MEDTVQNPILRGAGVIAKAAMVKEDDIKRLVLEEGFPAYKINGKGPWLCRKEDIDPWHQAQRDRYHAAPDNAVKK